MRKRTPDEARALDSIIDRLGSHVRALEGMTENDMGWLRARHASRFITATGKLRALLEDLHAERRIP